MNINNRTEVYLPLNLLEKDPENFFKPLTKYESKLVEENIIRHGIIIPLFVIPNGHKYIVKDGKERLEIAEKHNISPVKCMIFSESEIEAILGINIYRRQMSDAEMSRCIKKKEEVVEQYIQRYISRRIVPEVESIYKEGKISFEILKTLANIDREKQLSLVKSLTKEIEVGDPEEMERLRRKNEELEEKYQSAKSKLSEKSDTISKLQDEKRDIEARARKEFERMSDIKRLGPRAEKEHAKEMEEMRKNLKDMGETLKKRDAEINELVEDAERHERELQRSKKDAELARENLELMEKNSEERNKENLRKFYNPKWILSRCDIVKGNIEDIGGSIIQIPPPFMNNDLSNVITQKMEKIKDEADEIIKKVKEIVNELEKAA
jgi:methyl-accepting chemotaxis protein